MITDQTKEIEPAALMDKARRAPAGEWHHHCLSQSCFANTKGTGVIVLELKYYSYWCQSTDALKQELEELAYQQSKNGQPEGDTGHESLVLVEQYVRAGAKWHFHIAMPNCLLNELGSAYELIVENDETGDRKQWHFDTKPVALVRAIDDYYLGRKAN